jgi:hypothetical protein
MNVGVKIGLAATAGVATGAGLGAAFAAPNEVAGVAMGGLWAGFGAAELLKGASE